MALRQLPVQNVAPYAGAWIEIKENIEKALAGLVAPYAGAWIEIG